MSTNERAPKIYTRTGDKGKTSLIGGARVSKSHIRLDAYGTIDEVNSVLGVVRSELPDQEKAAIDTILARIQSELFNLGSQLACEDEAMRAKLPFIGEDSILALEKQMDDYSQVLKPLKNFILPGGSRAASHAHVARTVCRRAERLCVALADNGEADEINVRYVNRLSDFLFVLARYLNHLMKIDEPIWKS